MIDCLTLISLMEHASQKPVYHLEYQDSLSGQSLSGELSSGEHQIRLATFTSFCTISEKFCTTCTCTVGLQYAYIPLAFCRLPKLTCQTDGEQRLQSRGPCNQLVELGPLHAWDFFLRASLQEWSISNSFLWSGSLCGVTYTYIPFLWSGSLCEVTYTYPFCGQGLCVGSRIHYPFCGQGLCVRSRIHTLSVVRVSVRSRIHTLSVVRVSVWGHVYIPFLWSGSLCGVTYTYPFCGQGLCVRSRIHYPFCGQGLCVGSRIHTLSVVRVSV